MTRRGLIGLGVGASLAGPALSQTGDAPARKKKVAAIVTEYRYYSHADVICGRLLAGYSANNVWTPSRTQLVSLYTAQVPANDMSRDLAARHGFKIYPTIRDALTLGGGRLAVDAVVFVGEHGNYPLNDVGQKLYPRHELFSQILDMYEASGAGVPTYFDKHFSYSWEKASEMYRRAKKLGFPFMAGSSVPVAVRAPVLDPPLDTPITEAAAIGHGDLDAYGFHLLESLQCLVERRKGGETGIDSVEWIEGGDIWQWLASEKGRWARPLLEEAMQLQSRREPGRSIEQAAKNPALYLLHYRDGLRAAALMLTPGGNDRTVAMRVKGQDRLLSTLVGVKTARPLPHFDGLVRCIDEMFVSGTTPYPVERTLLTTGALALCFESRRAKKPVETPGLRIEYRAPARSWFQSA